MFNITLYKSMIYNSLFDDLREYCFDKNQYFGNKCQKNLIEQKLTNIYEYQKEESIKFTNKKLSKLFRKKYQRMILENFIIIQEIYLHIMKMMIIYLKMDILILH